MNKRYLPIGSIVKLKTKDSLFMITGYYSVEYTNDLEIYDYSGCAYPEGIMIKSSYCSFNRKDIDKVLYEGYKNDDYIKFTNELNEIDNEIINSDVTFFDDRKVELDKLDSCTSSNDYELPHYEFDEEGIIIE